MTLQPKYFSKLGLGPMFLNFPHPLSEKLCTAKICQFYSLRYIFINFPFISLNMGQFYHLKKDHNFLLLLQDIWHWKMLSPAMECLPRTGRGGCPRLQRRGCAGGRDARGRAIGRQNSLGEVGATPGSFSRPIKHGGGHAPPPITHIENDIKRFLYIHIAYPYFCLTFFFVLCNPTAANNL